MPPETREIEQYTEKEFTRWIDDAESAYSEWEKGAHDARNYYEDVQAPDGAVASREFVQENLTTDLINGLVGQLIGGKIEAGTKGGGEFNTPVKELVEDIVERNNFNQRHLEPISNHMYVEGLGGIYALFNPFRLSQYGIGVPEIYHLLTSRGELLLDPDSRGFMHEDDLFRIFKQKRLIQYAERKYPHMEGEIQKTHSRRSTKGGQENYCDIYITEFVTTDIVPISELDDGYLKDKLRKRYEDSTKIELDTYWQVDMINRTQLAKGAKKTGFNRFRLIPVIHTPRLQSGNYPIGLGKLMKGKQDQINVVGTVALEAVKADIKNLLIITNAGSADLAQIKREAGKTNGVVALTQDARVHQMQRQPLSPSVLQWYQWQRAAFDDISGRHVAERGAVEDQMSGKALQILARQGVVSEITKKFHLEYAITEMCNVILEAAVRKMAHQPFSITRMIDGEEKRIFYNQRYQRGQKIDEAYHNVAGDVINDLSQVDTDEVDLAVSVMMDKAGQEALEANKALTAKQHGIIGMKTAAKKLYPNEYVDIIAELEKENTAVKIVGQLMKLAPNELKALAQSVDNVDQFVERLSRRKQNAQTISSPAMGQGSPQQNAGA